MRAYEILLELKVDEIKYGQWIIKFSTEPFKDGKYHANGFLKTNNELLKVKSEGITLHDAIEKIKEEIDKKINIRKSEIKQNINKSDITRAAIDFNVEVTKKIFNNNEPTAGRFIEKNGIIYLDIATPEAIEKYKKELNDFKFRKIHDRQIDKNNIGTKGYGMGITPNQIDKLGLEFNGRYILEEVESPEPMLFRRFKLLFDSIVQHKNDRMIIGIPALTVATWFKKK